MNASESALNREEMETRRFAAAHQLMGGQTQAEVARLYGVSRTTASRWHHKLESTGLDALRKRRSTGRPSRLTPEQLQDAARMYREGPRSTIAQFARAIEARFGVRYDEDHVGRLMHKLGLRVRPSAFYNPPPTVAADLAAGSFSGG